MSNVRGCDVSVVVADDHLAFRKIISRLLQDSGMRVVGEAKNGNEAVRQCEHLRPEVIVLDIAMPLQNGFGASRQIAKLCPATKIIFLTVHPSKEYAGEAFRVGGAAFVCKKHAARDLLEAIETVLKGKTYIRSESAA